MSMATSIDIRKQRKKYPACDHCKAHRVLCHSQPPGIPCPRCLEKGIDCTTTPITRRKRRTKAEVLKAKVEAESRDDSGSSNTAYTPSSGHSDDKEFNSPQSNIPSLCALVKGDNPTLPTLAPPSLDLPASLVSGLFQTFRSLPQFHHPVIPVRKLETCLERYAWKLSALPPQDRALVQCILAVSSLSSADSLIIGTMATIDIRAPFKADLREYGRRREPICQQLRGEAMKLAIQQGITVHVSQENAASCYLLDFLEHHATGQGTSSYAMACNAHLRMLQEGPDSLVFCRNDAEMITWPSFLMQDALCALSSGKSLPFSKQDELLLCGEQSYSIEKVLETLLSERIIPMQVFTMMRPLTSHVIHLARVCSERLTGAYARRQPLDESALNVHLLSLDFFQAVVKAFKSRAASLIPFQVDDCVQALRICTFVVVLAWASLVLPLYRELERRSASSLASLLVELDNETPNTTRAQLELSYKHLRDMALEAAVDLAEALMEVPTIGHLTHISFGEIEKWAQFLLESADATELPQVDRALALARFRDALRWAGFSVVDRAGLVEALELQLSNISLDYEQQGPFPSSTISSNITTVAQSPAFMPWFLGPNLFHESIESVFGYD